MEGTFTLRVICLVCREVRQVNGEDVDSATEHRRRIASAAACPECKEGFVEVCIRADGSQVIACKQLHTVEMRATVEKAPSGRVH